MHCREGSSLDGRRSGGRVSDRSPHVCPVRFRNTLTHQPAVDDFDAYARYVTTDVFVLSHLGASVFGPRWPSWARWR